MPKQPAYAFELCLYRRGIIGRLEAVNRFLEVIEPSNVAEAMAAAPPEIRAAVREIVDAAPVSEEDWRHVRFFNATESEWPELRRGRRAKYEALRSYFEATGPA